MKITTGQLRSLQTLYGMFKRDLPDPPPCAEGSVGIADPKQLPRTAVDSPMLASADGDARAARLTWASQQLGRELGSFSELSSDEAAQLIDTVKRTLGQPLRVPVRRQRMDREQAEAFARHGRRGYTVRTPVLATNVDREEIYALAQHVGMERAQLESWFKSRSSPLCGRAEVKLLTAADCNRVRWALKAMLKRAAAGIRPVITREKSA